MARQHDLVQLDGLVDLALEDGLVVVVHVYLLELRHDGGLELRVGDAWQVEAGEEVGDKAAEEGHVVEDEFRHLRRMEGTGRRLGLGWCRCFARRPPPYVAVAQGAHEHLLLGHLGELALERAGHDEHGLERCNARVD